jgi:aminoglycoside phosphotransferase family enzyme/predicted kinase
MIVDDQRELIEFLSRPGSYPMTAACVDRIDTHSAVVFLVGARAYKLKRAVRYDYLDFSTAERRRRFCVAEVTLNRRTAPGLYEAVVPVTRETGGRFAIAGVGTPVDWLVQMRRFPDDQLLDRMAARGAVDVGLMPRLAQAIARLHASAERRLDKGGVDGMTWVVAGNERGLTEEGAGLFDQELLTGVIETTRRELGRTEALLEARRRDGWVRTCHGDLHLGNIVLLEGEPVLFDAIEFNENISCIDVLYDLAFLLTDLWRLPLRRHANELFNAYLDATCSVAGDYAALTLLPLFLSCRSVVRAKTGATASRLQRDPAHAEPLKRAAREYLVEAAGVLHPPGPSLIGIGGASGTGKSTVARHIAALAGAAPGAVVLRTDVLRKRLCGVPETTRLGPEAYTAEKHARVYAELATRADVVLRAGHSVIVDGVFGRVDERVAIERIAREAGAVVAGLWLQAPRRVLEDRVGARQGDASDATVDVLSNQLAQMDPPTWPVVDASAAPDAVADRAWRALDLRP